MAVKILTEAIGKVGYHLTTPLTGASAISLTATIETPINFNVFTIDMSNKFTSHTWQGADGANMQFVGSSIAYTSTSNASLIYRLKINGVTVIETERTTEGKYMSFVANRQFQINNGDVIGFTIESDGNLDLEINSCDLSFFEI